MYTTYILYLTRRFHSWYFFGSRHTALHPLTMKIVQRTIARQNYYFVYFLSYILYSYYTLLKVVTWYQMAIFLFNKL